MNIESNSSLRVRIAEAQGYTFKDEGWRYPNEPDWQKYKAVYRGDGFIGLARPDWIPVPDYPNDLKAMAEVRKTLSPHQRNDFISHLWKLTGSELGANFWSEYNFRGLYACIDSDARNQALAYLATINPEEGK